MDRWCRDFDNWGSPEPAARWVGKGALKEELTSPLLMRQLAARPSS
jgi:hypothetical protein